MSDMRYFGQYADFKTASKNEGGSLLSADNIIGDSYSVEFRMEDGKNVAWIVNKFGFDVGYLDARMSYQLDVFKARGWSINVQLAQVLYSDTPDPGSYWGRVAVVCAEQRYQKEIDAYLDKLSSSLGKGVLPVIDLSEKGISEMLAAGGDWLSEDHLPLEKLPKGTALVKNQRSFTDNMVEQGRKGNKGCYFVSYAFIAIVIAAVVALGLKIAGVI